MNVQASVATFLLVLLVAAEASILDHVLRYVGLKHPIAVVKSSRAGGKPTFCRKLECPEYTVPKTTADYEERVYQPTTWVSTTQNNIQYSDASRQMFMRLFGYIQGNNTLRQKIDMTVPVINRLIPGDGPACEDNYTMSFFLSPSIKNPPTPKDGQVFISRLPALTAYVRSFGGWATQSKYIENAAKLAAALKKDGLSENYHTNFYYTGGYDSPWTLFNRHNEIWFIKK